MLSDRFDRLRIKCKVMSEFNNCKNLTIIYKVPDHYISRMEVFVEENYKVTLLNVSFCFSS